MAGQSWLSNRLKDGEWEEICQRVVEEIVGREPNLEGAEWLHY